MKNDEKTHGALKIQRLRKETAMPKRATEGSAGLDLQAMVDVPMTLLPGQLIRVPTGLAVELPTANMVGLVFGRSGLGVKHGVALSNGVGVIDSDYRGEIQVGLCNHSDKPYAIQPGERVAQLVVVPVCALPVEEVDALCETERGQGGFGSTGQAELASVSRGEREKEQLPPADGDFPDNKVNL